MVNKFDTQIDLLLKTVASNHAAFWPKDKLDGFMDSFKTPLKKSMLEFLKVVGNPNKLTKREHKKLTDFLLDSMLTINSALDKHFFTWNSDPRKQYAKN